MNDNVAALVALAFATLALFFLRTVLEHVRWRAELRSAKADSARRMRALKTLAHVVVGYLREQQLAAQAAHTKRERKATPDWAATTGGSGSPPH